MKAVNTHQASTLANALRQFPWVLWRCAPSMTKTVAASTAVLLAGLGILLLTNGVQQNKVPAQLVVANLAVAVLWGLWFSRLVLLHQQAVQARMPILGRSVIGALGVLAGFTVLLPAALIGLQGASFWSALSSLTITACSVLLLALLPRIVLLVTFFMPALLGFLFALLRMLAIPLPEITIRPDAVPWQWLPLLLLPLVVWRWRAIVQTDGQPTAGWRTPTVMGAVQGGGVLNWVGNGNSDKQLPGWMWPTGGGIDAGPQQPVRALRALLGTPFAPLSRKQWMVQLGICAAGLLLFWLQGSFDLDAMDALGRGARAGKLGGMIGGLLGGMAMFLMLYGQRLAAVYGKPGGELNELALLPGFGIASAQRTTLLKALVQVMGTAVGLLLLAVLVMARWNGLGLTMQGLMLLGMLGLTLLTVLACLRPLAGQQLLAWPMWLLVILTSGLAVASLLYAVHGSGSGVWLARLVWLWGINYLVLGLFLHVSWRKFRQRAHPFLQS